MSDDKSLYLLERAFEELRKDAANRALLLHATRVVQELAEVCSTARAAGNSAGLRREQAAIDPGAQSAARVKLDRAFEALSGKSVRTVARLDLLTAIDDAVRLRDSLSNCARGAYTEELEPVPRGEYGRELLLEAMAIERSNDAEQTRIEDEPGWRRFEPREWPEYLTRAMQEPEQFAYTEFADIWPEYAAPLTAADVSRVVAVWQNRGRPSVGAADKASEAKWSAALQLMARAGLDNDVTPITLKSAWSRWVQENPGHPLDAPTDEVDTEW